MAVIEAAVLDSECAQDLVEEGGVRMMLHAVHSMLAPSTIGSTDAERRLRALISSLLSLIARVPGHTGTELDASTSSSIWSVRLVKELAEITPVEDMMTVLQWWAPTHAADACAAEKDTFGDQVGPAWHQRSCRRTGQACRPGFSRGPAPRASTWATASVGAASQHNACKPKRRFCPHRSMLTLHPPRPVPE